MPNKILGTPGAIEQHKRYRGGLNTPTATIRTWKGPRAAILAMIAQAQSAGYDWTVEEGPGPNASISMELPSLPGGGNPTEVPVNSWELVPGESEKDMLDSENYLSLTEAQKRTIRQAIANNAPPSPAFTAGTMPDKAYKLQLLGQRSVRVFPRTLRHTMTVSNNYVVIAGNTSVGRIISTATLIATEGIYGYLNLALNAAPFTNANPTIATNDPVLKYGWIKKPFHYTGTYGSRSQIVQEWEFNLWSVDSYGEVL